MQRSDVRHSLYRAKNGAFKDSAKELYELIEPMIPVNESWATFSTGWDIIIVDDQIDVIKPETDYNFIHSTCVEKSLYTRTGTTAIFDHRQLNVITIVESTMLEGKMTWENYNKDWGLGVDEDRKFIFTKLFETKINIVTDEMIKNSAKSDPAKMVKLPELSKTVVELKPTEMSPSIKAMMDSMNKKKSPKSK